MSDFSPCGKPRGKRMQDIDIRFQGYPDTNKKILLKHPIASRNENHVIIW